ncbi:MAG TPA: transglutaminase-like domain-containing protein [Thermoanaerobaculia bacterium]|nr:transglutaminase-like domain-containing protein [Thermoanaerobaculia bacterium]
MSEPIFMHPAVARQQFRAFAEGEITNANLALGALLIALEDHPRLNVDHYLGELDALAARVAKRCLPGDPPIFRLGHLHSEMFDADGYDGCSDDYYDVRNGYLHEVIDRKAGIPISLSIIFLHIASRIGLPAAGVGLPGHYIVKVQFELSEVYIDPFNSGATLSIRDIADLLGKLTGGQMRLSAEHLRAWNGRQTLIRVLGNLQNMWTRAGETRKAHAAKERMEILMELAPN